MSLLREQDTCSSQLATLMLEASSVRTMYRCSFINSARESWAETLKEKLRIHAGNIFLEMSIRKQRLFHAMCSEAYILEIELSSNTQLDKEFRLLPRVKKSH